MILGPPGPRARRPGPAPRPWPLLAIPPPAPDWDPSQGLEALSQAPTWTVLEARSVAQFPVFPERVPRGCVVEEKVVCGGKIRAPRPRSWGGGKIVHGGKNRAWRKFFHAPGGPGQSCRQMCWLSFPGPSPEALGIVQPIGSPAKSLWVFGRDPQDLGWDPSPGLAGGQPARAGDRGPAPGAGPWGPRGPKGLRPQGLRA